MNQNNYVIINDRAYDPVTGLPVDINIETAKTPEPSKPEAESVVKARGIATPSIHSQMQRSATLSRRYVNRPKVILPMDEAAAAPEINYSPVNLSHFTVKKAKEVEKFSNSPENIQVRVDRPAEAHPIVHRSASRSMDVTAPRRQRAEAIKKHDIKTKVAAPATKKELRPAHVLKNEAIFEAMNKEVAPQKRSHLKKQRQGRWSRFFTVASASLAIVLLAGYFTYLNMPNLSIRMAALQSGINAKYPGYRPDGYALSGPITFKDGEVKMQFAYAGGDKNFTIKQERSSWDSSAVKQLASSKSEDVVTTTVDGLTIYSYGSNATWVNAGVLYTVEGNAPLSGSQIQRIATSM